MRRWRAAFVCVAALALGACNPQAPDAPAAAGPLLPGLAAQLPELETIELRTAGDHVAVTLERKAGEWTVRERTGWPADPARVRTLLEDLVAARRAEAKTAIPERHAKIGVETIADAHAAGVEVRLRGKDWQRAIVIGNAPPAGPGRFVRLPAEAQAWRADRPLVVVREPAQWLDTQLFDVPLARIAGVRSFDAAGHAFELAHRDDRFRVVDAPSAAMGDSHRGDALAGGLEQLRLDDVAADDGAAAERTVDFFVSVPERDVIRLEAWRVDGRVWARVRECRLPPPYSNEPTCRQSSRWTGRRFLLPAQVAATLLMSRDQVLGRTP
jgi:hypothetical protein